MIKILVNEHNQSVPTNTTVRKLRGQEKPDSDQIIFMDKPFYGFFRSLTFCLAGFILLMIPGREIDHVGEFIFTNKEFFLYFL